MDRAVIVVTIVTSTIAFSSLSLAATDEEIGRSGDKMNAAFRCLTYARMFHDYKEEKRLFEIGLKAARDFVEGARRNDPKLRELWAELNSPSERVGRTNAMQPMSGRSNPSVRIMQFETTSVSPDASLPSIASRSACGVVPSRCSARMPDLIISLVI